VSLQLDALLEGLSARISGDASTVISELAYHSQQVKPGALFVALRGARTDGHRFAQQAAEAGAAAVLGEEPLKGLAIPVAVVRNTRAALADVAARFFGNPGASMTLIGVTGTNGKTSTVRMIESILNAAHQRVGSIGTISVRFPGVEEPSGLTTPESLDLQRTLARMRDTGVETGVLEVSSHSLSLGRVRTLRFAAAVYTHLSQDHLDFHADMEAYASSKAELFSSTYLGGPAILKADDSLTPRLTELAHSHGQRVWTFGRGTGSSADLRTVEEEVELAGSRFIVELGDDRRKIRLPLAGEFQVENALAAIATARALGISWAHISEGLGTCAAIPGRLERVASVEPIVLIDYAHTPDALERVLKSVRSLTAGRLITVFGCGGDRDRTKRAPMAQAACRHSDHVVATSDNPRSEDPDAILRDVAVGLIGSYEVIADRRQAIHHAIATAAKQDVVVIAGKGHEDYQIVGQERRPFDDRSEARTALTAREAAS
jgi:UDP-N-acetylmuramoyl-L-alanyl-D-glutamate--2,6-diaminopimelate ligase